MHEYSIVQSLVDSVATAVGDRGGAVHRVDVTIGELAGVDCGLLATAFEVFRDGTICAHATLSIARTAARWVCSQCGGDVPRGGFLRCVFCEAPARLAAGDDIVLQRIELEVA